MFISIFNAVYRQFIKSAILGMAIVGSA